MEKWDGFVSSRGEATPFHYSFWLRTLEETYRFEPLLYVLRGKGGAITGVFPLFRVRNLFGGFRIVSLPFSDYGYPLLEKESDAAEVSRFLLEEHGGNARYVEVRGPLPGGPDGFVRHDHYLRHSLPLDGDPAVVYKKLNRKTIRYSIRKAEKAGITVTEENTLEGLGDFYRLNLLTRRKHGVPPQPRSFFLNLYKNAMVEGHGRIFLARSGSRAVAGGLFLETPSLVFYKYSVSDPAFLSAATPGHLLTWKAVEGSCLRGFAAFDFGRTSPGNAGLVRYKEMWGAAGTVYPYHYYPRVAGMTSREGTGFLYPTATALWRKLPLPVTARIGPFFFRMMG